METQKSNRLSYRFLKLLCRNDYIEEILGDLAEYDQELKSKPVWKQKLFYWFHVMNFLQPWALKKVEGSQKLNQYGMFKNYFKTSVRSLRKNIAFSGINILGLAMSMSVAVLMILFLGEVYSFDNFHEKRDRIYRVTSTQVQGNRGVTVKQATGSYFIADQLKAEVSGVEEVLVMTNTLTKLDIGTEEKAIPVDCYFADESFFSLFSFELIKGNPSSVLSEPNQVVLTASVAEKLFGDRDPIGQLLTAEMSGYLQNGAVAVSDLKNGVVSGVVADPPLNSHLRFGALISLKTKERTIIEQGLNHKTNPGFVNNLYVYLVLNDAAEADEVENAMSGALASFNTEREDNPLTHNLQAMSSFITSDTYHSAGPTFSKRKLLIMSALTLIILLSACFNYTNLSLARALRRSKEVGVRKVVGASRFQVFIQFIVEAVVISFLALIIGVCLFIFIRPTFLSLPNPSANGFEMFELLISLKHIIYFIFLAIMVGLLAGILPAIFLSKVQAINAFKSSVQARLPRKMSLKSVLIVFQFTLSIGLIMCAVLINDQYRYTLSYDLGYETEDVLTVDIHGDYIDVLANEYSKIPEVEEVSKSGWVLGVGGDGLTVGMIFSEDRSGRALSLLNQVDENYLDMHDIEMLAGETFDAPLGKDALANNILVNEAFLKELNLGVPEESLGKQVLYNGTKVRIKGVFKDAVSIGLTKKFLEPMAFIQTNQSTDYKALNLKVSSTDLVDLLTKMEKVYADQDQTHPFNASFYEDSIAETYKAEKGTYTIISFLAIMAISISTLGLLGMAIFNTETRMKEIGIRKVLGARIKDLLYLLSKNFLLFMILAAFIAIPVTLQIVESQLLNTFWDRAPINFIEILSGFLVVLVVGGLTIGWQIRQAAISNPIDSLRNE
ncbi:ABC transporter permease [Roseivirga sp.]|uniref:ABC transporter permease n=1 Tax=Roseivirga sp. TaxID=1964215 RepID=UPI003B8C87CF